MDETFELESSKGNHKKDLEFKYPNGRKARKRGGKAKKGSLSKEQVCIACGIDQRKHLIMTVSNYGRISTEVIEKVYENKINDVSLEKHSGLNYVDKIKAFLVHSNLIFKGTKYCEVSSRKYKIIDQN